MLSTFFHFTCKCTLLFTPILLLRKNKSKKKNGRILKKIFNIFSPLRNVSVRTEKDLKGVKDVSVRTEEESKQILKGVKDEN